MAETFSFEDALQSPAPTPVKQAQTFSFEDAIVPQEASKTSNPLHGMFGRAAELLGSGAEAVQRVSAPTAEGIQQALPESMRSKYLDPEAIKERQKAFTDEATKYSNDIGYAPSTSLKELGDNPLKVIPFVAERVITSAPDMAGAALAFTPYVMTRSNEILNERLKNDNKTYEQATVGDVTAATTAAIAESTLERFATKRILPGGKGIAGAPVAGGAAKRIGKEVGLQSSTEAGEELAGYAGEAAGTEKGFDPEEAGLRMLEAGIVGGGLGGATRGGREVYDATKRQGFSFEEAKAAEETPMVEPTKPMASEAPPAETPADTPAAPPVTPPVETEPPVEPSPVEPAPEPTPVEEAPVEKPIEIPSKSGKIEGVDEIDLNPNELKLSKDVPQFKEDADEMGIVEPLKGKKYDYIGTPPIQVWRRLDGTLEVISGRHRWDLAKRTGADRIPAQVFDEAKGFNSDMAAIMDAELNIRDGKGKITDYVNYFKTTGDRYGLTQEDYEARGLLDGKEGKRAYVVAVQGSDDLIQALRGRQVKEDTAYRIAEAVPNDSRLQLLGLKLVNEKPLEQAINTLYAAKTIQPTVTEMGGDLFGFDDSGLKLAEDMGKLASEKQRALSADILTIGRAGRNPVVAKKYGINIDDPAAVLAKEKELKAQRAAWDNWASDPILVDVIRRELSGETVAPVDENAPRKVVGKDPKGLLNTEAQKARLQSDQAGLTGEIEDMFANKISIDDIVAQLEDRISFLQPAMQKAWVAQVGATLGVPSGVTLGVPGGIGEKGQAEFKKWADAYFKRVGKEQKVVEAAPTEAKPAKAPSKKPEEKKAAAAPKNWPKDIPTDVFRGYGRAEKGAAYAFAQVPIAGDGKYYTFDAKDAKEYGPKIEKSVAPLNNPLVIRDGNQWRSLTKEAGWKSPNPAMLPENEVKEMTDRLQEVAKDAGHDGIVVYWDNKTGFDVGPKGENFKLLNNVFGIPQVVVFKKGAEETLPSFQLEPEQKQTAAEKKAATEREVKEIADREREVFGPQPQTPETGIGYGMQDDMIGANGLTEQEFKKGIDKNSTEPGEPLVLRNVTLNENISYNDDVNSKVEDEQTEHYNSVENMKDVEQTEDVEYDLNKQIEAYEEYIRLAKQGKVTAKEVMDVAKAEFENGNISEDVFKVIEQAYKNNPAILEGIRLEVGKNKEKFVLGHFQPIARIIRLFKDTSGVIDPETVRHELAHSMEQMMTPDQKAAVVAAWKDELLRASRAEKTEQGKLFFRAVSMYLHNPTQNTLRVAQLTMPNITYYQYINPSEYWAVNAERLMKGQLGSGMDKFKSNMNAMYQGLRSAFGASNFWTGNKVFKQILEGDRFSRRMLVDYVQKTKRRNYKGDAAPLGTWDSRSTNWVEDMKYKYVDKYIDLLRAKQDIERTTGELDDIANAYQKETLSHGRIAKQVQDFTNEEARPLAETMKKNNISQEQLHEYLLARHAEEYNAKIAEINPEMGDSGSSISTQEANDYITSLGEARVKKLDEAAKIIDRMTERTRQYLVDNGLEDDSTIAAWEKTYKYYVPLYRKGLEYTGGGRGFGQGYASRGAFSKRATGSLKEVKDIMESIAEDRIRAIEKAEKARVGRALYAMAVSNPNPSFWLPINRDAIGNKEKTKAELRKMGLDDELIKNIMQQPKSAKIDSETGLVYYAPDNYVLNSNNVFPVRIDGKDRFIIFNSSDPRASRLISAMKNMDTPDVEGLLRVSAYVTRFFASVNTQYNPLFGAWNFARDVQGAALNLSTTELRGHEKEVIGKTLSAMRGIYADLRSERKTGKVAKGEWSDLWEDFQKHGGQTGYKAQFVTPKGDFKMIAKEIQNLNKGNVKKVADGVFGWLSDYNDSMENAVRLSAYKVALENGMSKDKAANLAKNLTVNFNRKGANSSLAGSLFAFFNASVQGTSRLYETLSGPMGKKIMFGGFALGVFQAIALELAGFEDDEPPQFVKEKSLVIPLALLTGGKEYISLPMPLGFNIFPGLGRIFMEAVLMADKGKNPSSKFFDALSLVANSFNPLGSSGLSLQTIAPTPIDPLVSLATNKDSFGRPIYREDRATNPQVGYERTRENTSEAWKWIAEQINWMTGGTDFKKGMWSPTGDEISYLAGQVTGGLGRELGKIYGGATDLVTGEDIAPYKIPLLGKLYGDAESKANVSNHFYQNATKLSEIEREIKGRKAPGWKGESAYDYIRRTPEAQLVNQVNRFENEISQLNKRKKELKARGATIQQIKHIEDIKERKMREFNKRYAKYQ